MHKHISVDETAILPTNFIDSIFCKGLTEKTKLSFASSNSSFIEHMRKPLYYGFSSSSSDNACTSPSYEGCSFTNPNHLTPYTDTTFTSCNFTNLVSDSDGGAIFCTGNRKLYIEECSFEECISSSGHGGAIYVDGASSFTSKKTLFTNCNSTNMRGGAIYFTSSRSVPFLFETSFISCYSRMTPDIPNSNDDGGSIFLYSTLSSESLLDIFESCRFIDSHCNGWGGGGYIHSDYMKLYCKSGLFASSNSAYAQGLGIHLHTAQANCLIQFCFCANALTSPEKTDVSFNRNGGSFSSSLLIHTFTNKNPANSVKTCIEWTNYVSRNWPSLFVQLTVYRT